MTDGRRPERWCQSLLATEILAGENRLCGSVRHSEYASMISASDFSAVFVLGFSSESEAAASFKSSPSVSSFSTGEVKDIRNGYAARGYNSGGIRSIEAGFVHDMTSYRIGEGVFGRGGR